jgi:hypothetical protein
MELTIPICLGIGVGLGAIIGYLIAERANRKKLAKAVEQAGLLLRIRNHYYAIKNKSMREALEKIEGGEMDVAKGKLAVSIATFYHDFAKLDGPPEWIARERQGIEVQAKSSDVLRVALADKEKSLHTKS